MTKNWVKKLENIILILIIVNMSAATKKTFSNENIKSNNSKVSISGARIVGNNNEIYGNNNIIVGNNNEIFGNWNLITGNNNDIEGNNNRVTGNNNDATGSGNSLIGSNNDTNESDFANSFNDIGLKYDPNTFQPEATAPKKEEWDLGEVSISDKQKEELDNYMKDFKDLIG